MNILKKNRVNNWNLYDIGQKLGLDKKDIYNVITNRISGNEQISYTAGPIDYCGAMYGSISINDTQYYDNTNFNIKDCLKHEE